MLSHKGNQTEKISVCNTQKFSACQCNPQRRAFYLNAYPSIYRRGTELLQLKACFIMPKTYLHVFLYLLVSRETKQKFKKKVETFSRLNMPTSQSCLNDKLIYNKRFLLSTSLISAALILSHHLCDSPVSILGLSRISVSK